MGAFPVQAVKMLARIATDVEPETKFVNYPPSELDETHAISEALKVIDKMLDLKCIVAFTTTGYTAKIAASERPRVPVVAFTPSFQVYHQLNLVWGVKPLLLEHPEELLEDLIEQMEARLVQRNFAASGDKILILGGSPVQKARGTNFLKIHTICKD